MNDADREIVKRLRRYWTAHSSPTRDELNEKCLEAATFIESQARQREESERENTALRGLVSTIMPCHYCGVDDIGKCPSGFPGCALMDDRLAGMDQVDKHQAQRIKELEEVHSDHHRLVRQLDEAVFGKNAAPQASLCDLIEPIRAELTRLREVVEGMPSTRDEVKVTMDDRVWHPEHGELLVGWGELPRCGGVHGWIATELNDMKLPVTVVLSDCFSTQEAAQAAAAKPTIHVLDGADGATERMELIRKASAAKVGVKEIKCRVCRGEGTIAEMADEPCPSCGGLGYKILAAAAKGESDA